MVTIDVRSSTCSLPPYPAMNKRFPSIQATSNSSFAIVAGTADAPSALYSIDLVNAFNTTILKATTDISNISDAYFSTLETISFPRKHGSIRSGVSYAVLMRPTNPEYYGPDHTLPPCIVLMHGGPTSNIPPEFNLSFQYYTSRGFALVVVNYLGSSGFGRDYRKGLDGEIGIMDVADGVSCVDYLASMGCIDRTRVGIVGASAGGYATLQSLCTYPDIYAGGLSRYGIGDWKRCTEETHKFESRYLDKLMYGDRDLSEKEKDDLLRQRSPLFNAEKIKSPVLLLQGSIDKVVPPNQAKEMEKIVKENGGEAKLIMFEGEGHGFSQAKHIKAAVEEEEKWWLKTLVREGQP